MEYFRSSLALLCLLRKIDTSLDLVNGVIVEFYGFVNENGALIYDEIIVTPPADMFVKLKYDVGTQIALPHPLSISNR